MGNEWPDRAGLRRWVRTTKRPNIGDHREICFIGARFGVEVEAVRSALSAEGWKRRPYGASRRLFWFPP